MEMVSYLKVAEEWEANREWFGVRENDGDDSKWNRRVLTEEDELYGTSEELYENLIEYLRKEFFVDKYSLCLQIRDKADDSVVHEFPRVVCPELFLEQLKLWPISVPFENSLRSPSGTRQTSSGSPQPKRKL